MLNFLLILIFGCAGIAPEHFIVDTKSPIIIQSDGSGDRHFGYSLANMKNFGRNIPHNQQRTSSVETLFIGAPKDLRLRNSGVVWACTFQPDNPLRCTLLSKISEQNSPPPPTCREGRPSFVESESEQWIGGSLSAAQNSSQLYSFAPRWKWNGVTLGCKQTALVGACYVTSNGNDVSGPLAPLNDPYEYISKEPNGEVEVNLQYALFGFASHITPANTLVVSAPGVRAWIGSFLEHEPTDSTFLQKYFDYDVPNVERYSYVGYSLSSGRIPGGGYFIVAGAPRARNLLGMVIITNSKTSTPEGTLVGKQFGAYFGYSVATADLNGDGYSDILVGAPMHTLDFAGESSYNTGCVFVYDGSLIQRDEPLKMICTRVSTGARFGAACANLGDINFDNNEDFAVAAPYDDDGVGTVFVFHGADTSKLSDRPTHIIRGKALGMQNLKGFGTSMSPGLDVDQNGTPDLAIGSFESETVVVVRTRPVAKPSVTVSFLNTLNQEINNFLPTLSDLVVRICASFKFSVNLKKDNRLWMWLKFEVDPTHNRFLFVGNRQPTVRFGLSSLRLKNFCHDRHLKLKPGVNLSEEHNLPDIQFQGLLWYNETKILESARVQHATIRLPFVRQRQQQDVTSESQFDSGFRSFNPYLPAPISASSGWKSLVIAEDNCKADGRPECDPDLKLEVELYTDDSGSRYPKNEELLVGEVDKLTLSMKVNNARETAYSPVFVVSLEFSDDFEVAVSHLSLTWTELPKLGQCNEEVEDEDLKLVRKLRCPRPLQNKTEVTATVTITNLQSLRVKDSLKGKVSLHVEVFPETQQDTELVKTSITIPLKAVIEVDIKSLGDGTKLPESDPRLTVVDVVQTYMLTNTRASGAARNKIVGTIWIPTEFPIGNGSMQIIGIANPSNYGLRCNAENFGFFNPSEFYSKENSNQEPSSNGTQPQHRSTRSTHTSSLAPAGNDITSVKSTRPAKPRKTKGKKVSPISGIIKVSECEQSLTSCAKIVCRTHLGSKGSREIRIQIYLMPEIKKLVSDNTQGIQIDSVITVVYPVNRVARGTGTAQRNFMRVNSISAVHLLGAAGGGILILFLVSFVLYKCGFFRRDKMEQLKQLKGQEGTEIDMEFLVSKGRPQNQYGSTD